MAWNFDGTEDTLDSCEILERIEELDALIEEERDKLPEFRKQEAILLALSLEEHAEYDALKKVIALARAFSQEVQEALSVAQFQEVLDRNAAEDNPDVCHTHDFMDANMLMSDAFVSITGHEVDGNSDEDVALWNAAWDIAKAAKFFA
jgi:hypothetical protein